MSASDESGTTHFGYREVPVADKRRLVGEVFSSVAGNYDLMNDLMSLGIHRVWKRYFVATAQVKRGDRVLDLAGGTGDIAALLRDRVGDEGEVVLGDINGEMLRTGRDRMTDRGRVWFNYQCAMTWVKPTGITPYSWMYNTEHVLFGRKGSLDLMRMGLKLSFEAPVTRHSEKPDVFYERVAAATPGPRLEMFSRSNRDGFVAWGNEVIHDIA